MSQLSCKPANGVSGSIFLSQWYWCLVNKVAEFSRLQVKNKHNKLEKIARTCPRRPCIFRTVHYTGLRFCIISYYLLQGILRVENSHARLKITKVAGKVLTQKL